ncbi:MAG: hypothetical protein IKF55_03840, partial [Oscillospiraceae bacterium]|nr:hypothetical protein [Oscillospiraceae bacterium]
LPSRGEIPSIESIPTVREVPINEGIDVVPEPRPLVPPDMPQSTPGPTIQQSEPLDYPGDDPAKSPGDDWEWRGKGKPEEGMEWYHFRTVAKLTKK